MPETKTYTVTIAHRVEVHTARGIDEAQRLATDSLSGNLVRYGPKYIEEGRAERGSTGEPEIISTHVERL